MAAPYAIDPGLDPSRLAPVFARAGRLHLPGILRPGDAAAVHRALTGPAPWVKSVRAGGDDGDVPLADWEAMTPERRADWEAMLIAGAARDLQFQFDSWRISDMVERGERRGGALAAAEAVYDFLNSETFLGFVRTLTGDPRCAYCDAQATRYRRGDFLALHHDEMPGMNRLYAYVLNLTPAWLTDWGGTLVFVDEDGHVAEGYAPAFNALNIFRVPAPHAVTQVASYAGADRLAITGWVRARR